MPSTVKYAISYPAGTTAPNVPVVMQTTAESVESALTALATEKAAKGLLAYNSNPAGSTGLAGTGIMCDLVQASLVINRLYRISYSVNTLSTGAANMAIAVALKKSVTTDATATGTDIDNAWTIYSAPVAGQGCTSLVEMIYRATATETVNIKAVMARATTTAGYDISSRKLAVYDMGYQF